MISVLKARKGFRAHGISSAQRSMREPCKTIARVEDDKHSFDREFIMLTREFLLCLNFVESMNFDGLLLLIDGLVNLAPCHPKRWKTYNIGIIPLAM